MLTGSIFQSQEDSLVELHPIWPLCMANQRAMCYLFCSTDC